MPQIGPQTARNNLDQKLSFLWKKREKIAARGRLYRNYDPNLNYTQMLYKSPINPVYKQTKRQRGLKFRVGKFEDKLWNFINEQTNQELDRQMQEFRRKDEHNLQKGQKVAIESGWKTTRESPKKEKSPKLARKVESLKSNSVIILVRKTVIKQPAIPKNFLKLGKSQKRRGRKRAVPKSEIFVHTNRSLPTTLSVNGVWIS